MKFFLYNTAMIISLLILESFETKCNSATILFVSVLSISCFQGKRKCVNLLLSC